LHECVIHYLSLLTALTFARNLSILISTRVSPAHQNLRCILHSQLDFVFFAFFGFRSLNSLYNLIKMDLWFPAKL